MAVPHPIPYQGSKRGLADKILAFIPRNTNRLVEPFAGSAAVSLAAASRGAVGHFLLNDLNRPLMDLWDAIINKPEDVIRQYSRVWTGQHGQERAYYDRIRELFNEEPRPHFLLYLLARCVKASVRYNSEGHFNQSPDNRRLGALPTTMGWHIRGASQLLVNRTVLRSVDYRALLDEVAGGDLVYLDPPYQGVCRSRDPRYLSGVSFGEFIEDLRELSRRGVPFILSYDGRTGSKAYGQSLPSDLQLVRIEIDAGRSTQATLLGKEERTYESLYVSRDLAAEGSRQRTHARGTRHEQLALFGDRQ